MRFLVLLFLFGTAFGQTSQSSLEESRNATKSFSKVKNQTSNADLNICTNNAGTERCGVTLSGSTGKVSIQQGFEPVGNSYATGSVPGIVSTGSQTFGGTKTFSGIISSGGIISSSGSGTGTGSATTLFTLATNSMVMLWGVNTSTGDYRVSIATRASSGAGMTNVVPGSGGVSFGVSGGDITITVPNGNAYRWSYVYLGN